MGCWQLVQDALDVRRLVEGEAGLELPGDVEALVAGIADAAVPGRDQAAQQVGVVGLAVDGRRLDGVDADALDAEVDREVAVGLEARDIVGGVAGFEQMLAPQVLGEAGEGEAVAGDLGLEPVAVVPGRVVLRVGVAVEAAELEPVELQLLQRAQHRLERDRALAVGADIVGPGADRGPLHRFRLPAPARAAVLAAPPDTGPAAAAERENGPRSAGEEQSPGASRRRRWRRRSRRRSGAAAAMGPLDRGTVAPAVDQAAGARRRGCGAKRRRPGLPRSARTDRAAAARPAGARSARGGNSRRAARSSTQPRPTSTTMPSRRTRGPAAARTAARCSAFCQSGFRIEKLRRPKRWRPALVTFAARPDGRRDSWSPGPGCGRAAGPDGRSGSSPAVGTRQEDVVAPSTAVASQEPPRPSTRPSRPRSQRCCARQAAASAARDRRPAAGAASESVPGSVDARGSCKGSRPGADRRRPRRRRDRSPWSRAPRRRWTSRHASGGRAPMG